MAKGILVLIVAEGAASGARAEVVYSAGPGAGAPSGMLGGYTMTPFDDERPVIFGEFEDVMGVPSPLGGELGFSIPMSHREVYTQVGGWATWSHGYSGDVYYSNGLVSVTMMMPPETVAFEFYAEPNPFSLHSFTAVADDGTSSGLYHAHGSSGATYAGFYGTDGSEVASIQLTSSSDFAIGEFAIAQVPEPAAILLLVAGGLACIPRGKP